MWTSESIINFLEGFMKKQYLFSVIIFVLLSIVGCSSTTSISSGDGKVPDWYLNHSNDENYFYAPVTAQSKDMQLAVEKATTDGRAEIGRQVEVKLNGLQKKFDEEVGSSNTTLLQMFTAATKTIVSTTLTGSKVIKKEVFKDDGTYRAYVLVQYPVGAAAEALSQQLKSKEELYTRYRASQAFKDLDEEVKKYDEWKAKQGQ